jgi:hypothetical protein
MPLGHSPEYLGFGTVQSQHLRADGYVQVTVPGKIMVPCTDLVLKSGS